MRHLLLSLAVISSMPIFGQSAAEKLTAQYERRSGTIIEHIRGCELKQSFNGANTFPIMQAMIGKSAVNKLKGIAQNIKDGTMLIIPTETAKDAQEIEKQLQSLKKSGYRLYNNKEGELPILIKEGNNRVADELVTFKKMEGKSRFFMLILKGDWSALKEGGR